MEQLAFSFFNWNTHKATSPVYKNKEKNNKKALKVKNNEDKQLAFPYY